MGVEREKRFLVDCSEFDVATMISCKSYVDIVQHYLSFDPVVRVRRSVPPDARTFSDEIFMLGIKGSGLEIRPEFEFAISMSEFNDMKEMGRGKIRKRRFILEDGRYKWEIDQFMDYHKGLWLAELEISPTDNTFELTADHRWLGREVTNDPQYTNAYLAQQEGKSR